LVELLIAIAALSTISIMAVIYLYQTLVTRDKILAQTEATEVANSVLTRIKTTVQQAKDLEITGFGTVLQAEGDTLCEEYTLSSQRIYYESSPVPCPVSGTQKLISNQTANITNDGSLLLFTGSPTDTDALTVTMRIRVQINRPFSSNTVTIQDSASRRR